jgi:hypothetical protein
VRLAGFEPLKVKINALNKKLPANKKYYRLYLK